MVPFDTFLAAVYTLVDTLYTRHLAPHKPVRRGRRPRVSDSEVLTLMVIGQWRGNSQRALLRHATTSWRAFFPRLLSQSAFNRRSRDLGGACAALVPLIADELGAAQAPYQILDTTPVPLARLCRGRQHRLFAGHAGIGRGGSDHHVYYGCSALLAVAADGPVTGFVVGPANTEGRWLGDALLGWRAQPAAALRGPHDLGVSRKRRGGFVGPTGTRWWPGSVGHATTVPYLADAGFTGRGWVPYWRTVVGATVLTPLPRIAETAPLRRVRRAQRLLIETINALLAETLHLAYPLAKTAWGVVCRIAAKCAAVNAGIWVNRYLGRPSLALPTLMCD
jgi:hypothetical protein